LILWSASWENGRWQTWFVRTIAVGVSLLSFPAIEVIRFEEANQWQPRLGLIGMVVLMAFGVFAFKRWPRLTAAAIMIVGLIGAIGPLRAFLQVRAVISALVGSPLGIGLGVWLNLLGHVLMVGVGGYIWHRHGRESKDLLTQTP
jgi:hypothetical protein